MEERPDKAESTLEDTLERLSLEQALIDAEVAIARARDLNFRLIDLREQLAEERLKNQRLLDELDESNARYEALIGNRAYTTAQKIWELRRAIGV